MKYFLTHLLFAFLAVSALNAAIVRFTTDDVTVDTISDNPDLSSLTSSIGTLAPDFDSNTTVYTANVLFAGDSLTVTPTAAQANASIQVRINGGSYATVNSGSASSALALNIGLNTIDILVTAQDMTATKTYSITVTRSLENQSITFASPGDQLARSTGALNLAATGGSSGNPVTFTVTSGPATLTGPATLAFTGAGSVTITASQSGSGTHNPAAAQSQTFNVILPKPDVAVGASLSNLVGLGIYTAPSGQLVRLISKRTRPVTGYASVANRVSLPDDRATDVLKLKGTRSSRYFRVDYFAPEGNVTASVVAGDYRSAAIDANDPALTLRAVITPNKKTLTVKKGKQKTILRAAFHSLLQASSTTWPASSDGGIIRVETK
jgi:hypothetical protein